MSAQPSGPPEPDPSLAADSDARPGERPALWYDGRVARARRAWARLADGLLHLRDVTGDAVETVELDDLVVTTDPRALVFGRRTRDGWRLSFIEPLPDAWRQQLPRRATWRSRLERIGAGPALAMGATAALILFLVWAYSIDVVVALTPSSWFEAVGQQFVASLESDGKSCDSRAGNLALSRLTERLNKSVQFREPLAGVRVIDSPIENALAVPGGQVVLFSGLIYAAQSPDAVAGVLAHELTHVARGHATRGFVRGMALGLAASAVGGDIASVAQVALQLSYGRAAEREADAGALAALARIDANPRPLADLFVRLSRGQAPLDARLRRLLAYVSTHPDPGDRQARFAAAVRKGHGYRPSLTADEWRALRSICKRAKADGS